MVKKLLLLIAILSTTFTYAETIKTDVLVIGNGASAVAAAMQSAHSKVRTILLVKGGWLEDMQQQQMQTVVTGNDLPTGLWGGFRKDVREFYKNTPGYDTTYNAPLKFEPYTGAAILKKAADTIKLLSIKLNTSYSAIKKDGTGWEVSITTNGITNTVKAKVIIDATENAEVVTLVGAHLPAETVYGDKLYRTAIAPFSRSGTVGSEQQAAEYYMPISALVARDADNLFIVDKALGTVPTLRNLPQQMAIGQGAGTIAAFCAFFKTTQKNLRVRLIQGELLDFKGYLLPFDDVRPTAPYFRAIQQIAATGLLKGVEQTKDDKTQLLFMPDSVVATAEIKPVLTEIYSRAFIWFNTAKPNDKFTIGNLLSFIGEITLAEPASFKITMQKEWKTKYKFTSDLDVDRPITRYEFAVLANKFLNPFARVVDLNGRMIN